MIGFLSFDDALSRLLASAYGMAISIYRDLDGKPFIRPPSSDLTEEEYWAALRALVCSLRAGDNVGVIIVDGIPQRLPLWHWYEPPYDDDPWPSARPDQTWEGRSILIDEDRFEAWLSTSNVLEVLSSRTEAAAAQEAAAELPGAEAPADSEPSRRGRKPKYDWIEFHCKMASIANTPDGLPEHQSDLERMMMDWCKKMGQSASREHDPAACFQGV